MRYYDPLDHRLVEADPDADKVPRYWGPLDEREFDGTRRSFVEGTDVQFVWDATSLSTFAECPRKYFYKLVIGRGGYEDSRAPLYYGGAYHRVMEMQYQMIAAGFFADDEDAFLGRVAAYASILGSELPETTAIRNKETLVRACVWRALHFGVGAKDEVQVMLKGDGTAATELSLRSHFIQRDGVTFDLTGHLDLVMRDAEGNVWPLDYKSHKGALDAKWVDSFTPGIQFPLYVLLAREAHESGDPALPKAPDGLMIEGLETGTHFNRHKRWPILFTEAQLAELLRNIESKIEHAIRYAEAAYWPMNEQACNGKFRPCEFKRVCQACPSTRDDVLERLTFEKLWCPATER